MKTEFRAKLWGGCARTWDRWEENDEKLGFSGLYLGFEGLASDLFCRFARNHTNRVKSYKSFFLIRGMVAALKTI